MSLSSQKETSTRQEKCGPMLMLIEFLSTVYYMHSKINENTVGTKCYKNGPWVGNFFGIEPRLEVVVEFKG